MLCRNLSISHPTRVGSFLSHLQCFLILSDIVAQDWTLHESSSRALPIHLYFGNGSDIFCFHTPFHLPLKPQTIPTFWMAILLNFKSNELTIIILVLPTRFASFKFKISSFLQCSSGPGPHIHCPSHHIIAVNSYM